MVAINTSLTAAVVAGSIKPCDALYTFCDSGPQTAAFAESILGLIRRLLQCTILQTHLVCIGYCSALQASSDFPIVFLVKSRTIYVVGACRRQAVLSPVQQWPLEATSRLLKPTAAVEHCNTSSKNRLTLSARYIRWRNRKRKLAVVRRD